MTVTYNRNATTYIRNDVITNAMSVTYIRND